MQSQNIKDEEIFTAIERLRKDHPYLRDRKWLEDDLEQKISKLKTDIELQQYQVLSTDYHFFYSGKPILTAKLSCRDWIIHNVLMRRLNTSLKPDNFKETGYGSQDSERLITLIKEQIGKYKYAVKTDIKGFFPSISHISLQRELEKAIKDETTYYLTKCFITSFEVARQNYEREENECLFALQYGIPTGLEFSYFSANLYLKSIDETFLNNSPYIAYFRYLDDILFLSNTSSKLEDSLELLRTKLSDKELSINESKTKYSEITKGLVFLRHQF